MCVNENSAAGSQLRYVLMWASGLAQEGPAVKFVPGLGAEFLQNLGFSFGPLKNMM